MAGSFTGVSELTATLFYERVAQTQSGDAAGGNAFSGNGSGETVALRWQNGGGEYFGIKNREGQLGLSWKPIYMTMSLVLGEDPGVIKLYHTFGDKTCYLTGHIDSTVDGNADPTDPTASCWRIVSPLSSDLPPSDQPPSDPPSSSSSDSPSFLLSDPPPSDVSSDPSQFVLQFYGRRVQHTKKDGVFLVIIDNNYKIEQYSYVEKHGLFSFKNTIVTDFT